MGGEVLNDWPLRNIQQTNFSLWRQSFCIKKLNN